MRQIDNKALDISGMYEEEFYMFLPYRNDKCLK